MIIALAADLKNSMIFSIIVVSNRGNKVYPRDMFGFLKAALSVLYRLILCFLSLTSWNPEYLYICTTFLRND